MPATSEAITPFQLSDILKWQRLYSLQALQNAWHLLVS